MKKLIIISVGCFFMVNYSAAGMEELEKFNASDDVYEKRSMFSDTLPDVFPENSADLIVSRLRNEAVLKFTQHQLPKNKLKWEKKRSQIKDEIIKKAGIIIDHELPLNYQETGVKKMDGYTVKNIIFQTRPGVYATANLYVPDGEGPFPAILNVHGHWPTGRVHEVPQSRGPSLALNGYVCLNIDAFGSGERTTIDGVDEYHGANLGASLMNIGESLLGIQVSDNMRGVDLLTSLPYVDPEKIGATGASGGGNQTMWVTAIDERIKASMPVVSVGTFESAIMRSNCVCELLVDGLTITETSGILALIAPRAVKMCNHEQDSNPTFYPAEMKRSYNNAKPIFKMLDAEDNIDYQLFDLTHGYWPEDREAMLGWFDLHLKGTGTGAPKKEIPFETLPEEELRVYAKGQRAPEIETIAEYCKRKGNLLRTKLLSTATFNADQKKNELRELLRINEASGLKEVHRYSKVEGWDRFALETSDNKLIPLLHRAPSNNSGEYIVVLNPGGKKEIPTDIIEEQSQKGMGVVLLDLSGTGEALSSESSSHDKLAALHTLSRAELWLGKTVLGEWVKELNLVNDFLTAEFKASKIHIDGSKETAIAALFSSVLEGNFDKVTMRNAPVSYLFDNREGVNYFSMGIHLPGFLQWGDVSLAAALSGKNIEFIDPVTMSGSSVSEENMKTYNAEFTKLQAALGESGRKLINR
jgi:hypothetical protein